MKVSILGKNGLKAVYLNRRKAVREKCLNCAGWSYKEVTNCEFDDCDLYLFRFGKGKQNAKARAKAIRNYCLWCMNGQRSEVSKCASSDCPLFPYRKGGIDRSAEIDPTQKKQHIEAVSEAI
ncbi:MAG: hypothetical protein Q7J15_05110 [Candidatus Desulfaltia sp.]|nr:hypothetical protein [Candidatus Desulfaltia sp.]